MDRFDKSCQVIRKVYRDFEKKKMGKLPTHLPYLADKDPSTFAISFVTTNGQVFSIGDSKFEITIQSISKVLILAAVMEKIGLQRVISEIGVTGNPFSFNSLPAAVLTPSKTISPFTNQGAIATTSKLYQADQAKYQRAVIDAVSRYVDRPLKVSRSMASAELDANVQNRALAWVIAAYGKMNGNVDDVLQAYYLQCAVLVNSLDIAKMAATFANEGINPVSGKRVITERTARHTMWALDSVSLPNNEEQWDLKVGAIPAKSGVSGGLFIVLPGVGGIGIVSPPLNKSHVSAKGLAAGIKITRRISKIYLGRKTARSSTSKHSHRPVRRNRTLRKPKSD